jgi:hypothetical protein
MPKNKNIRTYDIPRYEVVFDEEINDGIIYISLVKDPAIMVEGMCFSKETNTDELFLFKSIPEQQIVVGYNMIPDIDIRRMDENKNPYFIRFNKKEIRLLADAYNKNNQMTDIDMDHSGELVPGFIRSNWIVEDEKYDKCKIYGFEPIVGAHFVEMKIEDKKFWENEVKGENRRSFSIQVKFDKQLIQKKDNYSEFFESMTEEELKELSFYVSILDIPVHPNCKCEADRYLWVCQPNACKVCRKMQQDYNRHTLSEDFDTAKMIFEKHTGRKLKY